MQDDPRVLHASDGLIRLLSTDIWYDLVTLAPKVI